MQVLLLASSGNFSAVLQDLLRVFATPRCRTSFLGTQTPFICDLGSETFATIAITRELFLGVLRFCCFATCVCSCAAHIPSANLPAHELGSRKTQSGDRRECASPHPIDINTRSTEPRAERRQQQLDRELQALNVAKQAQRSARHRLLLAHRYAAMHFGEQAKISNIHHGCNYGGGHKAKKEHAGL